MIRQLWQSFSLLYRNPTFGRVWFGRSVSLFGDAIALLALPWFVLQVTGSGTAKAGILLSLQLSAIVTSLVIGTWIDRSQPRRIILLDNGLRRIAVRQLLVERSGLSLQEAYREVARRYDWLDA